MSAVTPDLYRPMYGDKIVAFFDTLLDDKNAGKPLMRPYSRTISISIGTCISA